MGQWVKTGIIDIKSWPGRGYAGMARTEKEQDSGIKEISRYRGYKPEIELFYSLHDAIQRDLPRALNRSRRMRRTMRIQYSQG